MVTHLRPALVLLALFTLLTGLVYPLAITGVAQAAFPHAADGSPLMRNGAVVGSALIGQNFTRAGYFWGRPSAAGAGYDARASSGSNLGPTAQVLADRVAETAHAYGGPVSAIPVDLLTASGSGLDPEISLAAAHFQAHRVAQARALPEPYIETLIARHAHAARWGEPRVNVLQLNLALDALSDERRAHD